MDKTQSSQTVTTHREFKAQGDNLIGHKVRRMSAYQAGDDSETTHQIPEVVTIVDWRIVSGVPSLICEYDNGERCEIGYTSFGSRRPDGMSGVFSWSEWCDPKPYREWTSAEIAQRTYTDSQYRADQGRDYMQDLTTSPFAKSDPVRTWVWRSIAVALVLFWGAVLWWLL